ncbi:DUF6268 family outer membrane beta-barrel protein [Kordia jejudonensis]|uniref:DUF6268 family outer membrane beta-barrel protein n=1 Tax=Kordia jejudonensis TaxID=1348245 RepID=UPI00062904AF|nr:DUF6268 family outer membrane beta-barrel protein [Kordia jejudonensis]
MRTKICLILCCFSIVGMKAQMDPNLLSFDYTMTPEGEDEIAFYRTSVGVKIPLKLKKGMLINSVDFDYFQLNHNGVNFSTKDFNEIYGINYTLMYVRPLSKSWSIMLRGGTSVVSNLASSIQSDDFLFNAGISFMKRGGSLEKPYQLMFGVGYVPLLGEPRILPLLSYKKRFNEKVSIGIGFPRTFIAYDISEKSTLKASTMFNRFYANLSEDVVIPGTQLAQKSLYLSIGAGLEYSYWLDENWAISAQGGYSFYDQYELLDADNNTLYDFEASSKLYFSTGIKFNIKSKLKKEVND